MLWTVAVVVVARDFIPTAPQLSFDLPTARVVGVYLVFTALLAVLGPILPGRTYEGSVLADGSRLLYKCNGLIVTLFVVALLAAGTFLRVFDPAWIANHFSSLFLTANLFAVGLSAYLFVMGRLARSNHRLAPSLWWDFVMGSELNPFVLGVNVKFFSYRPAMAGWLLVNLSFLCKQYQLVGYVTTRMALYQGMTAWYILDYFVNEPKMLSTWDIMAEKFGLMLVWGDYVFIVFAFSIQNFFLVDDRTPISPALVLVSLACFALGFVVFRGANSQKHCFKRDPSATIWGKPAVAVGGKLLVSGFWGLARHMNYTGDLLLALSFCLPCGFTSSLPYFYLIYLLLLTVHREQRDEERCSHKYKQLWDAYCRHVPYRMVPFIY